MNAIEVESVPRHFYQNQKEWQYRCERFDAQKFPQVSTFEFTGFKELVAVQWFNGGAIGIRYP